jgi:hypothetical protein
LEAVTATATVPAVRGMLCELCGVPGMAALPELLPGGDLWLLTYDTPAHAVMALRWAAWYVRGGRYDRRAMA